MSQASSELFTWSPVYETGLDRVDGQHRRLVALVNDAGRSVAGGGAVAGADWRGLLEELVAYAGYHFQEERQLIDALQVDARHGAFHAREHARFLHEVEHRSTPEAIGGEAGMRSLLKFLVAWLTYHILGVDQSMARQIAAIRAGVMPAEAYEDDLRQQTDQRRTQPLLDALEELVAQLGERTRTLETLNESLERRVMERTRDLEESNRKLEEMALTDMLTELPNRRAGLAKLAQLWAGAAGDGAVAVLMVDADNFKPVNDTHGHDAGDEVLRRLAKALQGAVRTDDMVCRMGGDEFLIICPATAIKGAGRVASQVWRHVNGLRVPLPGGAWQGSISVGVAQNRSGMGSVVDLLRAADQAVYAAKAAGRNCIRVDPG